MHDQREGRQKPHHELESEREKKAKGHTHRKERAASTLLCSGPRPLLVLVLELDRLVVEGVGVKRETDHGVAKIIRMAENSNVTLCRKVMMVLMIERDVTAFYEQPLEGKKESP